MAEYRGIDVSNWQGYINYAEVKDAGIEVVYIKASQGSSIKDAYFDINYENAKNNGVTAKEIAAVITHVAFYAGWPKAWAVFNMAKEVWKED